MTVSRRRFGQLADGRAVDEHTLVNRAGTSVSVIDLGGIVTAMRVADRAGRVDNVVLGFDDLADYEERNPNFGVVVGRCANRIAGARFALDGCEHRLSANEGPNTLHGGALGFGKRLWSVAEVPTRHGSALRLELTSDDGDQGFPGRLEVSVLYTLGDDDAFRIDYRATTDRPTVVNLSHHGYFNLAGAGSALGQRLSLPAARYLEVDAALIPTVPSRVEGTPFDFRQPRRIDERVREGHPQLRLAGGYDHCWILDRPPAGLAPAARLEDDVSGRVLEIETTEPAIQFYSGNFLDGRLRGAGATLLRQGDGVCLEPQHFPDAPNRPDFPSTVLRPGELFESTSVYRFRVA